MKVIRHCKSGHPMKRIIEHGLTPMDTHKIFVCLGKINKVIKGKIQRDKNNKIIKVNCPHRKAWYHVEPMQNVG